MCRWRAERAGDGWGEVVTMMSAEDFRRIALGMRDAVESAHMGHPDFRIAGKIFATLHADCKHGMVKLTPEQQETLVRDHPAAFAPENGAWDVRGVRPCGWMWPMKIQSE